MLYHIHTQAAAFSLSPVSSRQAKQTTPIYIRHKRSALAHTMQSKGTMSSPYCAQLGNAGGVILRVGSSTVMDVGKSNTPYCTLAPSARITVGWVVMKPPSWSGILVVSRIFFERSSVCLSATHGAKASVPLPPPLDSRSRHPSAFLYVSTLKRSWLGNCKPYS